MKTMIKLFCALLFLASSSSWAVDCYQGQHGGNTSVMVSLPTFSVPSNAILGSKIWESSDINVTVYCDNAVEYQTWNPTEELYAWVKLSAKNDTSVLNNDYFIFGVTYNGVDYDGIDVQVPTGACLDKSDVSYGNHYWYDPVCNGVTLQENTTFPARFRLYVKLKAFPVDPDAVYSFGTINVLQFDGEGGANLMSDAKNFNYNITGLENVRFLDCSVDIKVFPESQIVNFGAFTMGDTTVVERPFSVSTIRDATAECSQSLDVTLSFNTDDLYDLSHADMGNGLLMQIRDETDAVDLEMNRYYEFAAYNPNDASTVTHNYKAKLTKNPQREVEFGPFSKDLILKLNYE